jgi:putative phosphoribosyl transferase
LDLLTREEEIHGNRYLAIPRLAERLRAVTRILRIDFDRIDYLGAGVGAAIALEAAAGSDLGIQAVACLGGRPDLVARLGAVRAPVLLVVGQQDSAVLRLNAQSVQKFSCPHRLMTIPRAGHRLREPGALQSAAIEVRAWFLAPEDPRCLPAPADAEADVVAAAR